MIDEAANDKTSPEEPILGDAPAVSIIVPCFCEEAMLPISIPILTGFLEDLIREGMAAPESELLFVDDGSVDKTWSIITAAHAETPLVRGIRLSANFGQQNAMFAGFEAAKGDFVITVDSDLQDDISVIRDMIRDARRGVDVVYGVRKARTKDVFFKRFTAEMYYKLMKFLGVDLVYNHSEFRGISRRALEALMRYREKALFLRGLVRRLGFRTSEVYYAREERRAGETKYHFLKLLYTALTGITSFTFFPLRLVTLLGLGLFFLSFVLTLWILWQKFINFTAVPGWTSSVLPLAVFSGMQLFCLGIIGEYLTVIFREVKDRPRFHIVETTESGAAAGRDGKKDETCG